jgi:hypothetical protein
MASNEHKFLLDGNRHFPKGYENADNNSYLGKTSGLNQIDKSGNLAWSYQLETFVLRIDGAISTLVGLDNIRMPYDFYLTNVKASVSAASNSRLTTISILESGVSILSTPLTILAGEKTSNTATTPAVISDYQLGNDNEISANVTLSGEGAAPISLKVYLTGYRMKN